MNPIILKIREWWQTAETTTRMIAIGGGSVLLVVMVSIAFYASSPDWSVLYSGLGKSDAGAIIDKLQAAKIPYHITNDSGTIEVPSKDRDEMKIKLAKDNLPSESSLGYKRMDTAPFGMTHDMQSEQIRIMMEEELQKTLEKLEPVASVRVIISAGSQAVFANEDKKASATVVVHTKPGQDLTQEQVKGVVLIVSHSVPGLGDGAVAVMDGEGHPLWDGSQAVDGSTGASSTKHEAENKYAMGLQKQIKEHLDTIYGAGKSSVLVHAELNYDKVTENKKETSPGAQLSVQQETDTMTKSPGGGTPIGGPAGAASNGANTIPTYASNGAAGAAGDGNYKHNSKTINNVVNQVERTTIQAPGKIDQLSVAVFLDDSLPAAADINLKPWLETFIGADPTLTPNRHVDIRRTAFDKSASISNAAAIASANSAKRMEQMIQFLPVAALLIVGFFIVKALSKSSAGWHGQSFLTAGGQGGALPGGGNRRAVGARKGVIEEYGDSSGENGVSFRNSDEVVELETIKEKVDPVREQIVHMATEKPEQVALLIKGWMTEGKK